MDNQAEKHLPKQLIPYKWKKGVSGNPKGRPKGKTLKEFAREYLMTLPDEEKIEYLASLPTEIVWKMAEGNPETKNDITSGGKPIPIYGGQSVIYQGHDSNQEDIPTQETD
jgi:hypothetical protein